MPKIKELINFNEIKDVIDVSGDTANEKGKKNIIENYIISKRLKDYLKELIENFSNNTHKAIEIIGNYGSGKSHLLAWISSLLEDPSLGKYITDKDIKNKFEKNINRDYCVVKFELQGGEFDLSEIFFYELKKQLNNKYDINTDDIIKKDEVTKIHDYKSIIKQITSKIKEEKNPKKGFVVIFDEISDFIAQKESIMIKRDFQFLRAIAQVCEEIDFLFIGAMQEKVFSNPKYVDISDNISRIEDRFYPIVITKEDIMKVIEKRILKKDKEKYKKIQNLFEKYEYKKKFPLINSNPDKYISVFPVHPYVFELFDVLPFFEKRGAIKFTQKYVKKILDEKFPFFITFDYIYDDIENNKAISNDENVKPVMDAINTLDTKIDLIDKQYQSYAYQIIKALGVLYLYESSENNGAKPKELANELLIVDEALESKDLIQLVLDKLREVTNGQFISKTKDNYYYLDLNKNIDYDMVIKKKMDTITKDDKNQILLDKLLYSEIIENSKDVYFKRVFKETCDWKSKKSFREGYFIFDDNTEEVEKGDLDYNLVLSSPFVKSKISESSDDTAIIKLDYTDELNDIISKLAAIKKLINQNYVKTVMKRKYERYENQLNDLLIEILRDSKVSYKGEENKSLNILPKQPPSIDEYFDYLKYQLFDEYFSEKYNKYPKFTRDISFDNIKDTVNNTINQMINSSGSSFYKNNQGILSSLKLVDAEGNIDTSNSMYANIILDKIKEIDGNKKIEELVDFLNEKPFGLQRELVYLTLVVLTYNGQINMKLRRGKRITSSDLDNIFKSNGIKAFENIIYVEKETGFPVEKIIQLFKNLGLNIGNIRNDRGRTTAVKEFKEKTNEINNKISNISEKTKMIDRKENTILPMDKLKNKVNEIHNFPLEEFQKVNTVNDFNKVAFEKDRLKELSDELELINNLNSFVNEYYEQIEEHITYLLKSYSFLKQYEDKFDKDKLKSLFNLKEEIFNIISDLGNLLDNRQRRMLIGKMQQYKKNYITYYYNEHSKKVGNNIDWEKIEKFKNKDIYNDLNKLKDLKNINEIDFINLKEKVDDLKNLKCLRLQENELDRNYKCPHCNFPEKYESQNLDNMIDEITDKAYQIKEEWVKETINEIKNYKDNIELLSNNEKLMVEKILENKDFPNQISNELINTLNTLFKELVEYDLSKKDITEIIFKDDQVLDYEKFEKRLEEFKNYILEKGEQNNIRIKLKGENNG